MHEVLDSISKPYTPGMVACACNTGTQEVEARGFEVQGHPPLHNESEANVVNTKLCQKKKICPEN